MPDRLISVTVRAKRLDDFLETLGMKVNWIKIDVEGAEIEVLQSLQKTLEHDKPDLVIEVRKTNMQRLKKIMDQNRYRVQQIPTSETISYSYLYCSGRTR